MARNVNKDILQLSPTRTLEYTFLYDPEAFLTNDAVPLWKTKQPLCVLHISESYLIQSLAH